MLELGIGIGLLLVSILVTIIFIIMGIIVLIYLISKLDPEVNDDYFYGEDFDDISN